MITWITCGTHLSLGAGVVQDSPVERNVQLIERRVDGAAHCPSLEHKTKSQPPDLEDKPSQPTDLGVQCKLESGDRIGLRRTGESGSGRLKCGKMGGCDSHNL
jgi:hypothetical protein